ncbi:winged helix-turn-helix transcriptional regulator [Actinophytocola sp.]|uniref:winged helix-turn-helix transcriptional regulator n=1 Tax=Actinophytocola sp. TaxID=1872138 RepID=UPI003D6AD14C
MPYRQAVEDVMAVLRGQWTVAVLAALALGETRRKDLLPAINAVDERVGRVSHARPLTDRVLEDTLRRMQEDGLIGKRAEPGPFGATWYSLTPTGYSLLSALRPLAEWAQENRYSRRRQSGDRPAS